MFKKMKSIISRILPCSILALGLIASQSAYSMGKRHSSSGGSNYRLYTIKKGNHYSNGFRLDPPTFKTQFNYSVQFDESAKYTNVTAVNQQDINKLVGFTDCWHQTHKDSARFGWRWFNGSVQIFAYTYANSKRSWEYMGDAPIGSAMNYSIKTSGSQYIFNFNGKETHMARGCSANHAFKSHLYPYFGGDETAPQKVTILLKHL